MSGPGPVFTALKIVPEIENEPIGQRKRFAARSREQVRQDLWKALESPADDRQSARAPENLTTAAHLAVWARLNRSNSSGCWRRPPRRIPRCVR